MKKTPKRLSLKRSTVLNLTGVRGAEDPPRPEPISDGPSCIRVSCTFPQCGGGFHI